jgi:hypothetical protein
LVTEQKTILVNEQKEPIIEKTFDKEPVVIRHEERSQIQTEVEKPQVLIDVKPTRVEQQV